jgi:hypothetical protein
MIAPKIHPILKKGDYHIVVNDKTETVKIFDYKGHSVYIDPSTGRGKALPGLAKGVYGPGTHVNGGDTPPGLYLIGDLFVSKKRDPQSIWNSYGKYCWDLIEQEGQENVRGRAGICLHGGGSGQPDPMAPFQTLLKTLGCVRMHNYHLEHCILPLTHHILPGGILVRRRNKVWLSVYQDQD